MEYDEEELNLAIEKGTKAWADVPDISEWVSEQRGRIDKSLELQKKAVRLFGLKTQLLHAVEELTECSLEVQRVVRVMREHGGVIPLDSPLDSLLEEFCDARNALATIELLLMSELGSEEIEREQCRKNAKFAQIIKDNEL